MSDKANIKPEIAFKKLMDGNQRMREDKPSFGSGIGKGRRDELTSGQAPFAVVLTCADSRTPPEHIFDAGYGDLFVCRVAGNFIDSAILGSIEYAAAHTGCPMVMVLGHNNCGAVAAAVSAYQAPDTHESPSIDSIVARLLPAVIATIADSGDNADWTNAAAKKNVLNTCENIIRQSPILKEKVAKGEFKVVGGFYDLDSGEVEILYE